jgi:hypothetical protein
MEATLTHQVMDERRECGEPHARARSLASPGLAGAALALRGFRLSSYLSRFLVPFIPTAEVHLRSGEQVSGTLRLLDPAPGEGE